MKEIEKYVKRNRRGEIKNIYIFANLKERHGSIEGVFYQMLTLLLNRQKPAII